MNSRSGIRQEFRNVVAEFAKNFGKSHDSESRATKDGAVAEFAKNFERSSLS